MQRGVVDFGAGHHMGRPEFVETMLPHMSSVDIARFSATNRTNAAALRDRVSAPRDHAMIFQRAAIVDSMVLLDGMPSHSELSAMTLETLETKLDLYRPPADASKSDLRLLWEHYDDARLYIAVALGPAALRALERETRFEPTYAEAKRVITEPLVEPPTDPENIMAMMAAAEARRLSAHPRINGALMLEWEAVSRMWHSGGRDDARALALYAQIMDAAGAYMRYFKAARMRRDVQRGEGVMHGAARAHRVLSALVAHGW